ncbi:hypothetical protein HDU98_012023 [Podochytrium sp. JEL0797]|nr:hypothetical protein HDU98_012023 [Podochytrium sp. JEL0797]
MGADQSTIERSPNTPAMDIDLRSFTLLRVIGKGAFGKVRIVQHKASGNLYALKYINKMQCIRMRAIQNIFRERCILEDINHPLIVNLRYAFQDDLHMFMVLDLMEGGDLRFHLDKHHGFPEQILRGWAAEIVFGIAYLHGKNVLHRDLKPDNVLLDAAGHAHLTDFNIAVNFSDKRLLKSHSGTLAYMAPDILLDKGYMHQIDWWSLGVILYELFYGKRPFRAATNGDLSKAIIKGEFVFHAENQVTKRPVRMSAAFRDLLEGLLTVDRTKRLGGGPGGCEEVMGHAFFQGVDWAGVGRKEMVPSFVPDITTPNFEPPSDTPESTTLDESYLQYRPKQRQNRTQMNEEIAASTPLPSPGPKSLANFLGASPLVPTDPSTSASANILQISQLLNLAQIKDTATADPKATNMERIEAELDFIDANYDPYDWQVIQQQELARKQRLEAVAMEWRNNGGVGRGVSANTTPAASLPRGMGSSVATTLAAATTRFGGSLPRGRNASIDLHDREREQRGRSPLPTTPRQAAEQVTQFMQNMRSKSIGRMHRGGGGGGSPNREGSRERGGLFGSMERKKSSGSLGGMGSGERGVRVNASPLTHPPARRMK